MMNAFRHRARRAPSYTGRRTQAARLVAALAFVLLGGCASSLPPERFYSLSAGATPATHAASAAAAVPQAAAGSASASALVYVPVYTPFYIELQAVSVPQQVSRNQLVVASGAGRVELLEQERWAAPLASEIGQALSLGVTAELGAIDVFRTPTPEHATVYRISTNVQRFESAPGQYALVDAVWSVRRIASRGGASKVLTCRSMVEESVAPGYDALVAGHRRAVARIAADMAQAVRALAAAEAVSGAASGAGSSSAAGAAACPAGARGA